MSDPHYSVVNALQDIVFAPKRALSEVKPHPRWLWVPLLIVVLTTAAAFVYYYSWVDFEWLIEQTLLAIPAADRAAAEPGVRAFMTPTNNIAITVVAVVLMTLLIYAIQSVYLNLVNKVTGGAEVRYGQWYAFSAWTGFVGVFSALGMFMTMFLADSNQLTSDQLVPLSMNSLFFQASQGDPWFNWGNALTLVNFWMLGLMTVGYNIWTGASVVKSAIIVSLPWVLIFGIWAALI
jgi:hypothetical protein